MDYWDEFFRDCEIEVGDQKLFEELLGFYLEKRELHNFTAIREEDDFVVKHFYDSVMGWRIFEGSDFGKGFLEKRQELKVLDIGSGGGFPGVPIAVVNGAEVSLLDAVLKNQKMVNELAEKFELNVRGLHARAEDLAHDGGYRGHFDVVTCRAFADWGMLLELCLPFVRVGGVLLAYQGPNKVKEMGDAVEAMEKLGGEVRDVLDYELPDGKGERALVVIEKVKGTPKKYPRGIGAIKKRLI